MVQEGSGLRRDDRRSRQAIVIRVRRSKETVALTGRALVVVQIIEAILPN